MKHINNKSWSKMWKLHTNLSFKKKPLPKKQVFFFLLAQVFFFRKKEKVL